MSGLRLKPALWAFDPAAIDPEWLWFWRRARLVMPFWEGGGSVLSELAQRRKFVMDTTGIGPSWVAGPNGPRVSLPAGNANLNIPSSDTYSLGFTDDNRLTIIARIKAPSNVTSTRQTIYSPSSATGGVQLECNNGNVGVIIPGVFIATTSGTGLANNGEYTIIYSRAGTTGSNSGHTFWVNGVKQLLANGFVATAYADPAAVQLIGDRGPSAGTQQWTGQIDFVAILDEPLTDGEAWQFQRDPYGWLRLYEDAFATGGTATAYTLTGPTSGTVGVASSNFTVTPNGALSGNDTVSLSDGANGGTFSPTSLSFTSGSSAAQTFTYTPASTGTKSISATSGSLTMNGSPISYVSNAANSNQPLLLLGVA